MLVAETLGELADRGVTRLDYFHCDHFEPWRWGIRSSGTDEILRFNELTQALWYTKRLTLFYLPHVPYILFDGDPPDNMYVVPGDRIGFPEETADQTALCQEALTALVSSGHEIQLHVHHEGFTRSDVGHYPRAREWLSAHSSEEMDEARLELALRLYLTRVRAHTGLPFARWHFVHGNWALNASDPGICRVHDEIRILQGLGCAGDFTFPAGRSIADPFCSDTPYTVVPVAAPKGYDTPQADPLPLDDPRSREPGRFFIWNSKVKHPFTSIDYSSLAMRRAYWEPEDIAVRWLRGAPVFGDRAFLKTYAHSMSSYYWEKLRLPIIPHHWPSVQIVFEMLGEACASRGIEFHLTTAGEVYEYLMTGEQPVALSSIDVSDFDPRYVEPESHARGRPADEATLVKAMDEKWRSSATRREAVALAEMLFERYGTRIASKRAGAAYLKGQGVDPDLEKAYFYLSSSVHNADATVLRQRAEILLDERFSAHDRARAIEYLTAAAAAGDSTARRHLEDLQKVP